MKSKEEKKRIQFKGILSTADFHTFSSPVSDTDQSTLTVLNQSIIATWNHLLITHLIITRTI